MSEAALSISYPTNGAPHHITNYLAPISSSPPLRAAALGSNVEARRNLRIMISVATHNDPSTAPIIVRSNAPELSSAELVRSLCLAHI